MSGNRFNLSLFTKNNIIHYYKQNTSNQLYDFFIKEIDNIDFYNFNAKKLYQDLKNEIIVYINVINEIDIATNTLFLNTNKVLSDINIKADNNIIYNKVYEYYAKGPLDIAITKNALLTSIIELVKVLFKIYEVSTENNSSNKLFEQSDIKFKDFYKSIDSTIKIISDTSSKYTKNINTPELIIELVSLINNINKSLYDNNKKTINSIPHKYLVVTIILLSKILIL